jgi:V/A-type H+/Na+-transporting ATPase subunit I
MIIPMTKYSFLVYHREYEDFLQDLRDLGVVHLIEKQADITDDIRDQYQLIDRVDKVIRFLNKKEVEPKTVGNLQGGLEVFEEIVELQSQLEHNHHALVNLQKELNELLPWGDFSSDLLKKLHENNISFKFYITQTRKFDPAWQEEYPLQIINNTGGNVYFVVIEKNGEQIEIPAEEFRFPKHSLSDLRQLLEEAQQKIHSTEARFDEYAASSIPALQDYKNNLIQLIEYDKAKFHTLHEAENRLMIVEGWVPENKKEELNDYLDKSSAVYITAGADPKEKVPIMLKNKGFSSKFEVLGELYSLPKYNELDLTPFFAPFYTLFFGFCLGDAGYGLLIVIATLFARRKVQKELKPVVSLVFYLGLSTILFGLIGGTFFGINLFETNLPFYSSMQSALKAEGTDINNILFYLSLVLGGIQIMFGMILKAINEIIQFGWKLALGTIGWIILIIGMVSIYMVSKFAGIEMEVLKPFTYGVLGLSGLLILFLNNLKRNVLMNLGVGLWNSYNMVTGLVGDLLSYIRLFALGISSAILGFVFNSLAVSMSGDIPVLSIVFMVIILVIGHSINLFMSGLGSFVHPMRLTFVEFYKNAGFAGGGKKYNPFRKIV